VNSCADFDRLVVANGLGLLEADEAEGVTAHVASCTRCATLAVDAEACASELALPEAPAMTRGFAEIAERIDADKKRRGLRVAVGCAYCKDTLAREEAVYCAACLAAHHRECFGEHGSCSAPGCGETRFVESRVGTPAPPRQAAKPSTKRLLILAALTAGISGAAALSTKLVQQRVVYVPTIEIHAAKATSGEGLLVDLEVGHALVPDVVAELGRRTGRSMVVAFGADKPITLSLTRVPLGVAISSIARAGECDIEERPDGIVIFTPVPRVHLKKLSGDVRDVVRQLAEIGKVELIIPPDFKGTVDAEIPDDVSWIRELHAIVKSIGDFELVEERPSLLRIVPRSAIQVQKKTVVIELHKAQGDGVRDLVLLVEAIVKQDGTFAGMTVEYQPQARAFVATGTAPQLDALKTLIAERDVAPVLPVRTRRMSGPVRSVAEELAREGHAVLAEIAPSFSGDVRLDVPIGEPPLETLEKLVASQHDFDLVEVEVQRLEPGKKELRILRKPEPRAQ
jgi:hypothetical protein